MKNKQIVTRFAPSPTGVLHTGSARTALYNFLYAKKMGGEFRLRIEDTDVQRSKEEYVHEILRNLRWLGLNWDGEIVLQLARHERHEEVALEMLERGKAYYCFASAEEVETFRKQNPHHKYVSPWRHAATLEVERAKNMGIKPTIRLKVEHEANTTINDLIAGTITVENRELDDMVLLRSDGTPTYMLAVVVDDHDMGVSHVIRGDDHLTNAFRQKQIYQAMDWDIPEFAHIPLIHDKDGKKLSKRHGALGVDAYQQLGYLPEAVDNHLLRLGFGHRDEEIITMQRAIEIFDLSGVGKSPARFDLEKLNFINAHYMRALDLETLFALLKPYLPERSEEKVLIMIKQGLELLRQRSNTLVELAKGAEIFYHKAVELDTKSQEVLAQSETGDIKALVETLNAPTAFSAPALKEFYASWAHSRGMKLSTVMQLFRAILLGTFAAPGIFEVMEILGRRECIKRATEVK